jgi:hypothetical protein
MSNITTINIFNTGAPRGCATPPFMRCGGAPLGCFGYGFNPECGLGFGLGMGLGMGLAPAIPSLVGGLFKGIGAVGKGIGAACSWTWNKAIVPAAKWVGKGIGTVCKGVWSGIKGAASWIGNGIKNLWNKIF